MNLQKIKNNKRKRMFVTSFAPKDITVEGRRFSMSLFPSFYYGYE